MKFGHWRGDCNKLKEDQKHNRVRQIEEVDTGSQSSNATTATGPTPSTVRRVSIQPVTQERPVHVMVEMSVRVLRHPPLTLSITFRAGLATIIWVTNLLWLAAGSTVLVCYLREFDM